MSARFSSIFQDFCGRTSYLYCMEAAKRIDMHKPTTAPSVDGAVELVESFSNYFEIVPAFAPELRENVFRIRYNVYAEELGWEDRKNFPAGMEKDAFDPHSLHCLLRHRPSNEFIGCVRLVLNNPDVPSALFPIEECFGINFLEEHPKLASYQRHHLGEISRIAVLSSFRHRQGEKNKPHTEIEDPRSQREERRRFPHIALGLYLAAGAMGIAQGKSCVFAMMEPKLARRLRIFGIKFEQLADPIDHRGLRAPFIVTRENFTDGLAPQMGALLNHISDAVTP